MAAAGPKWERITLDVDQLLQVSDVNALLQSLKY
jgi:hypothetical protein